MSRLPKLDPATMSPEQLEAYDAIRNGPRGVVQGPLEAWLNSAGLAARAQALGAFCRFGSSLPPRLSELAILITGAYWQAGFEWHIHAPIGIKAGLDPAMVETLRTGAAPSFVQPDEAAIYAFATELLHHHTVSDATYQRTLSLLGVTATVDLVGVLGYYGLISMTIKAFELKVPEGASEPF
jgi:4-carboxymuconolactone decarboxylase